MKKNKMNGQMMSSRTALGLLYAVMLSSGTLLLSACSTTPDETYKKSQMTKSLDYPPDLEVPVTNKRFSMPIPGSSPISTPIPLPTSPPASRKPPASQRGGHSH